MGAPGALAEGERETHPTYALFRSLRLGASHEMQKREGEAGCRRGEKAFGRHVINLKKEREEGRWVMKGIRDNTCGLRLCGTFGGLTSSDILNESECE